jgi:hypothetical protein
MRVGNERGIALVTVLVITMMISALLVGVTALAIKQQQARFQDHDRTDTFYASQAGVEKLTNDLGRLFAVNYAPTDPQVQALTTTPPSLGGNTSFVIPGGAAGSGYTIARGTATTGTIAAGKYAGLKGNITPYDVTVTAKSGTAAEVSLTRRVNAVAIPVFQFGIFSETDLSFFAGPTFNFGGKVHTNGDLYLAKGTGSELILADKVTVWGDVIRTKLANGYPVAGEGGSSSTYLGATRVLTVADGCGPAMTATTCRALGTDEGSMTGNTSTFNGALTASTAWPPTVPITGTDGISKATYHSWIVNGARGAARGTGATRLDLPITTDGAQPIELIRRPAVNENTAHGPLYDQRYYRLASVRIMLSDTAAAMTALPDAVGTPVDLTGLPAIAKSDTANASTLMNDNLPLVTGFILVNMQNKAGDTWSDVTNEFLTGGVSGVSLAPGGGTCTPAGITAGTSIIRFQRVKDNGGSDCTIGKNYWPNSLFDTREALNRDVAPTGANANNVQLAGVMYYTEMDILALRNWLAAKRTTDSIMETTGYVVYFSDRRGNHQTVNGTESGEYGFEDVVYNNGTLDTGEDVNGSTALETYGGVPEITLPAGNASPLNNTATQATFVTPLQARVNRPVLFRRALKLVNGNRTNMLVDAAGKTPAKLGLTIAAENPVYIQGDYNASMSDGTPSATTWALPHVATAVIGDAVTLLSNAWTDLTSYSNPYAPGSRAGSDTVYRTAIVSGKGMNFVRPAGVTTADFGTDGGTHNFLRLLEGGGRTTYYMGSIVSLYYNRQALGTFKCCNTVYSAPTRDFHFDNDFTTMSLLPPRTPMFRTIDITSFSRLTEPPTP